MKNKVRGDDLGALKPAGVVFAALVAGLGSGQAERAEAARPHAPLEPAAQGNAYFVDPTNHPGFEEDASLVVGPSEPKVVLGEAAKEEEQSELFELLSARASVGVLRAG